MIVPNIETHNDTSLIKIQIDPAQALTDLKRLGELIHSRQPEQCAEVQTLYERYAQALLQRKAILPLSLTECATCSSTVGTYGRVSLFITLGKIRTASLVVNNLRDLENDRKGNKRTLAVALGRGGTRNRIPDVHADRLPDGSVGCLARTDPLDSTADMALAPAGGQIRPERFDPDRPRSQRGVGRDGTDCPGLQPAVLGGDGVWLDAENVSARLYIASIVYVPIIWV